MPFYSDKPPRRPNAKVTPDDGGDGIFAAVLCAVTVLAALRVFVALLAGPPAIASVGDRIAIDAVSKNFTGAAPILTAARLADARAAGAAGSCRLDLAAMLHPGGVLSVLAVGPDGVVLSWAGGATASGDADCRNSEVMVSPSDYVALLKSGPQNIHVR